MEEEKTNTENTNTENTGSESTGSESTGSESTAAETPAETPAETATETATAPEPVPAAEETPAADAGGDDAGEKKRPMFLTVLGVLTFIGAALQLLGSLGSLSSLSGIIMLVAALGCVYGVIQMWKLKKMGFYIYAICEIAPVVYALVTVGTAAFTLGALGGGIMAIFAAFSMFFPVLFIILYALNLKHMK